MGGARACPDLLEKNLADDQMIGGLRLLPKEGKEDTSQHTNLTDPEEKHPLNKISPQVGHIRAYFSYLLGEPTLKAFFDHFNDRFFVAFPSLVD